MYIIYPIPKRDASRRIWHAPPFKGTSTTVYQAYYIPHIYNFIWNPQRSVSSSRTVGLKAMERKRERGRESKTGIEWNPVSRYHIQFYECKVLILNDFDIVPMVDHYLPDQQMGKVTAQFTFCPASAPGVRFLHAKGKQLVPMIQQGIWIPWYSLQSKLVVDVCPW